jgi:hypothetical protein
MAIENGNEVEIQVVGSSKFGRYPKISAEKTLNMFSSDGWLINYSGYKNVLDILTSGVGRGIFNSVRGNFLLVVISSNVFKINPDFSFDTIPVALEPGSGDVFMDENLSQQICIVDGKKAYIYSYVTGLLTPQTLTVGSYDVIPNYVSYHNTFFLISSTKNSQFPQTWYAFQFKNDNEIEFVTGSQFTLQTKPDFALAVHRLPGKGNNVLVLGNTVGEVWQHVGEAANYRRVSSFNIDSGVVNVSTIAASEQYLCYLAQNENNAPFIMMTDGSSINRISSDGIDNVLSRINFPEKSTAFFYRQDGHLFYQLTFYDPTDNLTLVYDFNTQSFFHATDENLNYHPATHVVFFHEKTYFISLNHGSIFLMDTDLVSADYKTLVGDYGFEIPRIRICNTVRQKNSEPFRLGEFGFYIEQGMPTTQTLTPRVDMSFSKDGNQSFSSVVSKELNPIGKFRNRLRWQRMGGNCNEFTIQLRFFGFNRFVVNGGVLQIF